MTQHALGGIRVSTDRQNERQGPERQRQDILSQAAREGYEIVAWVEESVSGADQDRAAENQYFQALEQSPGLNIFFSAANRVGRHIDITVGIVRKLHKRGGRVWIAGIGDLTKERNWKTFARDALEAEFEYTNLVNQMARGKLDKLRRGRWPHGAAPFAIYLARDRNGISTHPIRKYPEWETLERIYELVAEHGGFKSAQILEREGRLTPTGGVRWDTSSVLSIARNTVYKGLVRYQNEQHQFEGLLEWEVWERTNAAILERGRGPRTLGKHLLTGHVFCAVCDGPLTAWTGTRGVYYPCPMSNGAEAKRRGKERCVGVGYPRAADLEQTVWAYLLEHLPNPAWLEREFGQRTPEAPDYSSAKLLIREKLKRIGNALVSELFEESEAKSQAAPLKLELARLEALERGPVSSPAPDWVTLAGLLGEAFEEAGSDPLERRGVLKLFGVRVWVGREGIARVALEGIG